MSKNTIPREGYLLTNWNMIGYRATALAYMQRENLNFVEHRSGKVFSLEQIKSAIINFKS